MSGPAEVELAANRDRRLERFAAAVMETAKARMGDASYRLIEAFIASKGDTKEFFSRPVGKTVARGR